MTDQLLTWLCSLPADINQSLTDQARRWLGDLHDSDSERPRTTLEKSLENFLSFQRKHTEQDGDFDLFQIIPCPQCSKSALQTICNRSQAIWTDEPSDEWPFDHSVETVQLSPGHSIECPHCGFTDAEPATY